MDAKSKFITIGCTSKDLLNQLNRNNLTIDCKTRLKSTNDSSNISKLNLSKTNRFLGQERYSAVRMMCKDGSLIPEKTDVYKSSQSYTPKSLTTKHSQKIRKIVKRDTIVSSKHRLSQNKEKPISINIKYKKKESQLIRHSNDSGLSLYKLINLRSDSQNNIDAIVNFSLNGFPIALPKPKNRLHKRSLSSDFKASVLSEGLFSTMNILDPKFVSSIYQNLPKIDDNRLNHQFTHETSRDMLYTELNSIFDCYLRREVEDKENKISKNYRILRPKTSDYNSSFTVKSRPLCSGRVRRGISPSVPKTPGSNSIRNYKIIIPCDEFKSKNNLF